MDVVSLSLCAGKKTKRAKFLTALRAHNAKAVTLSCHIALTDDHRTQCACCGQSASLSHATHWFARQCDCVVSGRFTMVSEIDKKIEGQIDELTTEAKLLRSLASRLK